MQAGDFEGLIRQVDARDIGATDCHAFSQDATTTAHVQNFFALKATRQTFDPVKAQWVNGMKRFELTIRIPPARGESTEFVEFGLINVR
jgi:hypothetical protein